MGTIELWSKLYKKHAKNIHQILSIQSKTHTATFRSFLNNCAFLLYSMWNSTQMYMQLVHDVPLVKTRK